VFGEEKPIKILAGGHLNTDGVDESISITLVYKGGRTATLISHNRVELMNDAFVFGTEGKLNVRKQFTTIWHLSFIYE
jgi:dihydrodiol dehydrogenase / D-xylose 1-dehydrogenase (NADP)